MSFRRTLGVFRHTVKREVVRAVFTPAVAFRTKRLIVFLTPGYDSPSGGILSIAALYRESIAVGDLHRATVALCTIPTQPPLLKYSWFENRNYLLDLETLIKQCGHLEYVLLHIPEYVVNPVSDWLTSNWSTLQNVKELQLNVLVQNIDLVQGQNIAGLKRFGKVTCTTAHEAYSNSTTREALGVSLHRLSCCNGPELYSLSEYEDKEPLLIVSPDDHPMKKEVLREIEQSLPTLNIHVIKNLHYNDYVSLTRRAKWSLTFGEGLDGYFVDTVFNGGVAFAVFNERFFTPGFANLETVYPSWDVLMTRMCDDLKRLDEPVAYKRCWKQTYDLLTDIYSTDRFRENLRMFYRSEYTFP